MAILDLSTYKTYQKINSDQNDDKIEAIIPSVNSYITSYCNRTFLISDNTDKVEYFDATQSDYYPLEFPIVSVASIKYSTEEDGVYDEELTAYTDYVIDVLNSRVVPVGVNYFVTATTAINSGEITYTAGLDDYPPEIVQAAVLLTEYYMEQAYTPRKSLAGASVDTLIQPDFTAKLPPHVRRILEHHRAWSP